MTGLGRKLRAALGVGLTWAVPWGLVGASVAGLAALFFLRLPPALPRMRVAIESALATGIGASIMGFIIGSAFGLTLIAAERNSKLSTLSTSRFALLGTVVGAALSTGLVFLSEGNLRPSGAGMFVAICSVLGGVSAAASLALARRTADGEESDLKLASGEIGYSTLPDRFVATSLTDPRQRTKSSI